MANNQTGNASNASQALNPDNKQHPVVPEKLLTQLNSLPWDTMLKPKFGLDKSKFYSVKDDGTAVSAYKDINMLYAFAYGRFTPYPVKLHFNFEGMNPMEKWATICLRKTNDKYDLDFHFASKFKKVEKTIKEDGKDKQFSDLLPVRDEPLKEGTAISIYGTTLNDEQIDNLRFTGNAGSIVKTAKGKPGLVSCDPYNSNEVVFVSQSFAMSRIPDKFGDCQLDETAKFNLAQGQAVTVVDSTNKEMNIQFNAFEQAVRIAPTFEMGKKKAQAIKAAQEEKQEQAQTQQQSQTPALGIGGTWH